MDENCARLKYADANGYVPAADYEALKAKLAEVTDQLEDATDTLDQIEAESACFDGLARSAGYVKLEPGQRIISEALFREMAKSHCTECAFEDRCPNSSINCELMLILRATKEARDE